MYTWVWGSKLYTSEFSEFGMIRHVSNVAQESIPHSHSLLHVHLYPYSPATHQSSSLSRSRETNAYLTFVLQRFYHGKALKSLSKHGIFSMGTEAMQLCTLYGDIELANEKILVYS